MLRILCCALFVSSCSNQSSDQSCHTMVSDTLCVPKWAEVEITAQPKGQLYLMELKLLWNDELIKVVSDDARSRECTIEEGTIIANVGENVVISRPASLSRDYLESEFRVITRRDGKPLFWSCDSEIDAMQSTIEY